MNEYLAYVKKSSLSVEDASADPTLPPTSLPDNLATKGLLMESVTAFTSFKLCLKDSRLKDQYLRDHFLESAPNSSFSRLQSDIARQSIRDYESSLSMIRYLQGENEALKRRNEVLEREAKDAKRALGE